MPRSGPRKPFVGWRPTHALLANVDAYREAEGLPTRTAAMERLMAEGLAAPDAEARALLRWRIEVVAGPADPPVLATDLYTLTRAHTATGKPDGQRNWLLWLTDPIGGPPSMRDDLFDIALIRRTDEDVQIAVNALHDT